VPPTPVSYVDYVMFVLRAARHNLWLCIAVTLVVLGVGIAAVLAWPRTYGSSGKVFLEPTSALTAALTAGRQVADDKPKAINRELVVNRKNLLALIQEGDLFTRWKATRTWPFELKDQLFVSLMGEPAQQEKELALVHLLESSIFVTAEDPGTIRFTVQWREAEGTLLLATMVQRNLFRDLQANELGAIERASDLLQEELVNTNGAIAPAIQAVQDAVAKVRARNAKQEQAEQQKNPSAPKRAPAPAVAVAPKSEPVEVEQLARNRLAQRALLEPWQQRVTDLKFQMTELRSSLGPEHPTYREQASKLAALSKEPEELTALRARETELMDRLRRMEQVGAELPRTAAASPTASGPSSSGSGIVQYASLRSLMEREQDDPEVMSSRIHLENTLAKSRELSARLDSARLELATTKVGFMHRYRVVDPPELPRQALKPNRPKLFAIVALAALLLGLLSGAARELIHGRIREAWQVRALGVPVIAQVELRNAHLPRL
jgi:hypothetical protein